MTSKRRIEENKNNGIYKENKDAEFNKNNVDSGLISEIEENLNSCVADNSNSCINDIIDRITELRRDAFVTALTHMASENNIIGTFGEEIYSDIKKESFIRAAGFIPIPIEGVDTFIFEHMDKSWNEDILKLLENSCDVIKSTLIYKLTEKCPIIYSSKFILVTSNCPYIYKALELSNKQGVNVKKIFGSDNIKELFSSDAIKETLKDVNVNEIFENIDVTKVDGDKDFIIIDREKYKIFYKKLEDISKIYARLINNTSKSNNYSYIINLAKFYSAYIIDLDKRLDFFLWLEKTLSNTQEFKYSLNRSHLEINPDDKLLPNDELLMNDELSTNDELPLDDELSINDDLPLEKKKKNIYCRCPRSIIKNSDILEKYFLIFSQSYDEKSDFYSENKGKYNFDVEKDEQYYLDVVENTVDVSDCVPNGCKFESKYIINF